MNVLRIRNEMRNGKTIFDLPLRVTFYARVSTDKDEQLNSLENQIQYYTELIQSKPNWTYIEGYIDEGISGTSVAFWKTVVNPGERGSHMEKFI